MASALAVFSSSSIAPIRSSFADGIRRSKSSFLKVNSLSTRRLGFLQSVFIGFRVQDFSRTIPSVSLQSTRSASCVASSSSDPMSSADGYEWDLVTIGVGSGGTRASRLAASLGAKVAAIELPYNPVSSDTMGGVGGTCVLRGCVPKKILVYGSAFQSEFEDAVGFGWKISEPPTHDWHTLVANKTKEIERLNGVYKRIVGSAGVTLIEGRGKVLDAHTVEVESGSTGGIIETRKLSTKNILVAVGGYAVFLDIPGKEYAISSDEALSLPEFPKSIAIIGGGYIAVEFAGVFKGLGSNVQLIYRQPTPLRGFDDEMREAVAQNLQGRGVQIHPKTNPTKIERVEHSGKYLLHTDKGDQLEVDAVMFATGRKPRTRGLGLEEAGVLLDKNGAIIVNEYSQSSVPSIWAVGDVTDRVNLTPVALMEGNCFVKTVFQDEPTKPDYEHIASAVFCQPPLAVVGMNEQEANENLKSGKLKSDILVFTSSFTPMKNTVSGRKEKTLMKLLVEKDSDKVLGASMCGPDSAEIMQAVAIAMKCGVTKKHFDSTVGIHPTAAEEFVTMRTPTRTLSKESLMATAAAL